jgi:hypothetical protein
MALRMGSEIPPSNEPQRAEPEKEPVLLRDYTGFDRLEDFRAAEAMLQTGTLTPTRDLLAGRFAVYGAQDGTAVTFIVGKDREGTADNARNEEAGYLVSTLMGFNAVPPTVQREMHGQKGFVQMIAAGVSYSGPRVAEFLGKNSQELSESDKEARQKEWNENCWIMAIFDYITMNVDRNARNFLMSAEPSEDKNPKLRFACIDHQLVFNKEFVQNSFLHFLDLLPQAPERAKAIFENFARQPALREELRARLNALRDPGEVDALFERIDYVTGLIREDKPISINDVTEIIDQQRCYLSEPLKKKQ